MGPNYGLVLFPEMRIFRSSVETTCSYVTRAWKTSDPDHSWSCRTSSVFHGPQLASDKTSCGKSPPRGVDPRPRARVAALATAALVVFEEEILECMP